MEAQVTAEYNISIYFVIVMYCVCMRVKGLELQSPPQPEMGLQQWKKLFK